MFDYNKHIKTSINDLRKSKQELTQKLKVSKEEKKKSNKELKNMRKQVKELNKTIKEHPKDDEKLKQKIKDLKNDKKELMQKLKNNELTQKDKNKKLKELKQQVNYTTEKIKTHPLIKRTSKLNNIKTSLEKYIKEQNKDLKEYDEIELETVLFQNAFKGASQSYIIRKLLTPQTTKEYKLDLKDKYGSDKNKVIRDYYGIEFEGGAQHEFLLYVLMKTNEYRKQLYTEKVDELKNITVDKKLG